MVASAWLLIPISLLFTPADSIPSLGEDLQPLIRDFNEAAGKVRLVALLSPT